MSGQTYTGRLDNDGAQVSIENGPILAIRGPNPCATAAGQYARFGETQPVTVTGTAGEVDNIRVLYVTSIGWATQAPAATTTDDVSQGGAMSLDDETVAKPKKSARKKSARKSH